MKRCMRTSFSFLALAASLTAPAAALYTASEVVEYRSGMEPPGAFSSPSAALGLPSEITGSSPWDGNYSAFNAHYAPAEIVQIGPGGRLTLRLERFVRIEPGHRHLGVWENVFLVAGSDGLVGNPPGVFGEDSAVVEVSANGTDFVSVGVIHFNRFGNYWADSLGPYSKTSGSIRADFGRPFLGNLSALAGADYGKVLEFLDGTAGGTWIDLSQSGLEKVGWVRFSGVAPGLTLEIDAVAINTSLAAEPTVKPRLAINPAQPAHVILASTARHATYQLQIADDLSSGWRNHGDALPGTGGELAFHDPDIGQTNSRAPLRRFYRVLLP